MASARPWSALTEVPRANKNLDGHQIFNAKEQILYYWLLCKNNDKNQNNLPAGFVTAEVHFVVCILATLYNTRMSQFNSDCSFSVNSLLSFLFWYFTGFLESRKYLNWNIGGDQNELCWLNSINKDAFLFKDVLLIQRAQEVSPSGVRCFP